MSAPEEPVSIIRYVNGRVDDVVITGDTFRLEQMDKARWFLAVYRGDERTCFDLFWDKKRREIVAEVFEDSIGCHDDTQEAH